jgi:phosphate:Na+ symporter
MGSMVLLDLMGGVALLLWGLHMVHSGILRAFGADLRLLLAKALNNRFTAFAAGLGLTALLQSSTATALNHQLVYIRRSGEPGPSACDHARR